MAVSTVSSERLLATRDVLAGLASLGSGDLSALPLETLPLELLQRLAGVCRAPLAGLVRLDADGCPVPWHVSDTDGLAALPSGLALETFVRRLVEEGRPRYERLDEVLPDARAPSMRVRVLLGAPLVTDGRVFGAVYIGLAGRNVVRRAQLERFALLADRLALSLELARATAERRAAERLKSDFLAMVSHELRTPLTAILGYTDLLLRQLHGPLNDQQMAYQRVVRASAERLLALINDLLEVSRLQGGICEVEREPVDVAEALRQAVAAVADEACRQGVTVRLSSPAPSLWVLADRSRLLQMLRHLLANAIKFTPSGGQVVLSGAPLGQNEVCLAIKDTGAGLAPWQAERIWDCFYQADSSAGRAAGGVGLGLSLVKRLAELQGGRVWVESDGPGLGSTFSLALPAAPIVPMPRGRPATTSSEVLSS